MKKDSLNPQQARFVQYYIESGNAKQSALKAGYSESSANNANTLLKSSAVSKRLDEHQSFLVKSSGWNKARLVSEIEGVFQQAIANEELGTALKSLELIGKVINVTPSTKTMEVKHSFEQLLDRSNPVNKVKDISPQTPEITVN